MSQTMEIEYIQRDVKDTAIIFDLDGCISDDSWRSSRLPDMNCTPGPAPVAFDFYHAGCGDDAPLAIGATILREAINDGHFIIFATARPQKVIEMTSKWIQRHFFIQPNKDFMIMCRPDDDASSSVVLKSKMIDFLQQWQAESDRRVIGAYDDRDDIVEMYSRRHIDARVLDVNGLRPCEVYQDAGNDAPGTDLQYGSDGKQDPAEHVSSCFVSDTLERTLETFHSRRDVYGDNDIMHGRVMKVLFPGQIVLSSEKDHRMFLMMTHVVGKLTRFAASGMTHKDSAHDAIVYMAFVELLADQHNIKVQA